MHKIFFTVWELLRQLVTHRHGERTDSSLQENHQESELETVLQVEENREPVLVGAELPLPRADQAQMIAKEHSDGVLDPGSVKIVREMKIDPELGKDYILRRYVLKRYNLSPQELGILITALTLSPKEKNGKTYFHVAELDAVFGGSFYKLPGGNNIVEHD